MEDETPRGNEWEVVSLTASTYAAAPGPQDVHLNDSNSKKSDHVEYEVAETTHTMFMSSHFTFPPCEHENLPLEPAPVINKIDLDGKDNLDLTRLTRAEDFCGIQTFDENSNLEIIHGTKFGQGEDLHGLHFEQTNYSDANFSSFYIEPTIGESTKCDNKTEISEILETYGHGLDLDGTSQFFKLAKDNIYDGCEPPHESWWKRRAYSFYVSAKQVNSVWSIFIAAAVTGLVIFGQKWQQERWRVLYLNSQISIGDVKHGRMLGTLSRFKDVIVGGQWRKYFIGSGDG